MVTTRSGRIGVAVGVGVGVFVGVAVGVGVFVGVAVAVGVGVAVAVGVGVGVGVGVAVGVGVGVLVGVQYAFPDADVALKVFKTWQDYNLFFAETPLGPGTSTAIGAWPQSSQSRSPPGSGALPRFEQLDRMDRGKVRIVQPEIGRVRA